MVAAGSFVATVASLRKESRQMSREMTRGIVVERVMTRH